MKEVRHCQQFHSNLLTVYKRTHPYKCGTFCDTVTERSYCTCIRGVSAAPRLRRRLRDSRHSSAWFIFEGCHCTDGSGSYTPQQITRSCLPALLEWHTLTPAHTHVFQLCGCYQLQSSAACSGGKCHAVSSIRGRGCVNGEGHGGGRACGGQGCGSEWRLKSGTDVQLDIGRLPINQSMHSD